MTVAEAIMATLSAGIFVCLIMILKRLNQLLSAIETQRRDIVGELGGIHSRQEGTFAFLQRAYTHLSRD